MLAGVGPMGLGAIDVALHGPMRPSLLVVTDIDPVRLERAEKLYPISHAREMGVELHYVNTRDKDAEYVKSIAGGTGFDDVFVMAPVRPVVEMGDYLLGMDGCMNFFAGPSDTGFKAEFNFYNVHYGFTHVCSNSGGNKDDLREALDLMSGGAVDPSAMVTHVGGLNCVAEVTLALPKIPGGKKLIYNHIDMPLTAIEDFGGLGNDDPLFVELAKIVEKTNGLWSVEAEKYLLEHGKPIG